MDPFRVDLPAEAVPPTASPDVFALEPKSNGQGTYLFGIPEGFTVLWGQRFERERSFPWEKRQQLFGLLAGAGLRANSAGGLVMTDALRGGALTRARRAFAEVRIGRASNETAGGWWCGATCGVVCRLCAWDVPAGGPR